jgi:hypothetical protein
MCVSLLHHKLTVTFIVWITKFAIIFSALCRENFLKMINIEILFKILPPLISETPVSVPPQDLLQLERPLPVPALRPGGLRQQGHPKQPHQGQAQRRTVSGLPHLDQTWSKC